MKLTCVLATRGRPDTLAHTVAQTLANVREESTRILVCADADDAGTVALLSKIGDDRIIPSIREREDDLGSKFNRALAEAPADVYSHMVDYAPFMTPGFDSNLLRVVEKIPDNIGVVNCRMPTLCFTASQGITHGLAKQLGFIYPPYFPYWFVDHWLDDIARLINRLFYVDNEMDCSRRPGTQEMREPAFWATFFDVMAPYRRSQAARIIKSKEFQDEPWRKDLTLPMYPLLEQRSKWINDMVRAQSPEMVAGIGAGAGDERYTRIRAQAVTMIRTAIAEMEADQATEELRAKGKAA